MKVSIWRIIGNELPPRDTPGSRLSVLRTILTEESELPGAVKWFYLNRIVNPDQLAGVVQLLNEFKANYVCMPFDKKAAINFRTFLLAGVAINKARNEAIAHGHAISDWSVILDGDCFFELSDWDKLYTHMLETNSKYVSIPHCRVGSDKLGEPMLAFRKDSSERFDESRPFAQQDKVELLLRLGHSKIPLSGHLDIEGDKTQLVSKVYHLATGSEETENKLGVRERVRRESLFSMFEKVSEQ